MTLRRSRSTRQEAWSRPTPRFFVPPYVGHRGWIGVRIDGPPDWRRVATLVRDAYVQVAPPRLLALVGGRSRSHNESTKETRR